MAQGRWRDEEAEQEVEGDSEHRWPGIERYLERSAEVGALVSKPYDCKVDESESEE